MLVSSRSVTLYLTCNGRVLAVEPFSVYLKPIDYTDEIYYFPEVSSMSSLWFHTDWYSWTKEENQSMM